jgi:adenosylcobinamide-phosphate synthase
MTAGSGGIAVVAAAALDQLLGDPRWSPHPVVLMGSLIRSLRSLAEAVAGDRPWALRLGGVLITITVVSGSSLLGWGVERIALDNNLLIAWLGRLLLVIGLASALAARSLRQSVLAVLQALPASSSDSLDEARRRLSWIVGRDVTQLNEAEIVRAAAESASENAVDGVFAPLFWMLLGAGLWQINSSCPGPLALAWGFKAASTLDSMLGYRSGRLLWLGTAGAKLDDLLTWLPCRLVMLSLPLISQPWRQLVCLVRAAERDGSQDPSPNAGRSEAIYAHCVGISLGGANRYGDQWVNKPMIAAAKPPPDRAAVGTILRLTNLLELSWLAAVVVLMLMTTL